MVKYIDELCVEANCKVGEFFQVPRQREDILEEDQGVQKAANQERSQQHFHRAQQIDQRVQIDPKPIAEGEPRQGINNLTSEGT